MRRNRIPKTLYLFLIVMLVTLLSCDWFAAGSAQGAAPTVDPLTILLTEMAATAQASEPEIAAETPQAPQAFLPNIPPVVEPTAGVPSTNATGETCVPGTWRVNPVGAGTYIQTTLKNYGVTGYTVKNVSGQISITFGSNGTVGVSANNFFIQVGVTGGMFADYLDLTYDIEASGASNYSATDTVLKITNANYGATADLYKTPKDPSISIPAVVTMNLEELLNFAHLLKFGPDLTTSSRSFNFTYNCTGDTMIVQVNPYAYISLYRVIE